MNNELIKLNPVIMDLVHSSQIEKSNPFTEEIFLIDVLVALHDQSEVIREHINVMTTGEELEMLHTEREQVCVCHKGDVIGEIPLDYAIIISRLLDAGKKMKCKVSYASTNTHKCFKTPFSKLLTKIYMVD